tara:strand:+ start:235 stop:507 length:273 start_codon:yes stop_codon:yes gene_type:complete
MKRNDKQNLELLIETTIAIKAQTKIQKQVIQELADNGLLTQTFKNGLPSWSVRDDLKISSDLRDGLVAINKLKSDKKGLDLAQIMAVVNK